MMDGSKFKTDPDPADPVNSVIITGDVSRIAGVFHPSQPFSKYATPANDEADRSLRLMNDPNSGAPLSTEERAAQKWTMSATTYRALYEAVVLRGEKTFNPRRPDGGDRRHVVQRAPPSASGSYVSANESTMSNMPAPPFRKPVARPVVEKCPVPAAAAVPDPMLVEVHQSMKTVTRDIVTIKEKIQYTMQVILEIRDKLGSDDEGADDSATEEADEEPITKKLKTVPAPPIVVPPAP